MEEECAEAKPSSKASTPAGKHGPGRPSKASLAATAKPVSKVSNTSDSEPAVSDSDSGSSAEEESDKQVGKGVLGQDAS